MKKLCERADVETKFFLHAVPVREDDFDEGRESFGFNNPDFMFEEYGGGRASWGEDGSPCLAEVPLPEYDIATVSTGQFNADGRVWGGEVPLDIERSADGVGLLVTGQTAQAFAIECAAGDVALWHFGVAEGTCDQQVDENGRRFVRQRRFVAARLSATGARAPYRT